MTILTINTDLYLDSAHHASSAANAAHDAASLTVTGLQASHGMAGWDGAGMDWAVQYDPAAQSLTSSVQELAVSCSDTSRAMTVAAGEYIRAEHIASLGTSLLTHPLLAPTAPDVCLAPPPPAGQSANPGLPPAGWDIVEGITGTLWPNGDPERLRAAATIWSSLGSTLDDLRLASISSVRWSVSQLAARDLELLRERSLLMDSAAAELAEGARELATACTAYASRVEQAHQELAQEAEAFAWEVANLVAAGAILSLLTAGGAAAVTSAVGAARTYVMTTRIAAAIQRLVTAARASHIVSRSTTSVVRLRQIAAAGSGKLQPLTKPLPPAVTTITTWVDRSADFIAKGPLWMLTDSAKLGIKRGLVGKYASDGDELAQAIHIVGFTAAGSTLTFSSIKWGKAAYDRLKSLNDATKVIEQGHLPWLPATKTRNYPGLPQKLPVTVPQRLRSVQSLPAPKYRVLTKPLPAVQPSALRVNENPLLIQRRFPIGEGGPLIVEPGRPLPVHVRQPLTASLFPPAPAAAAVL